MILVIGAMASGKRSYVRSLGFAEHEIADGVLDDCPVVANAHRLAADYAGALDELADKLSEKAVVICNEVGCGLVPAQAEQREQRERAGRLCALLAARADRVVRMVCGIPQPIKER